MTAATSTLAINGGEKTVPDGLIKNWPPVDDTDRNMVLDSLNGGKHAFGPNCKAFQDEFAAWNGNKYAIFTNSGTAALHMANVACGVGAGDHVIVTSYSWSSSATSILHHNGIPVFVDIDFDTINMDVDKIEEKITPRTKAIVAVHLHGLAVNMDKVMAVAKKHNLKVIEDACQAHGAMFNGQKVGTFGDCAAFSFNQNKCLCAGESGMFVTNDEEMRMKANQLWSFGETRTPLEDRDYHSYALGWMYRGNDLTAAFGRAQLAKLDGYFKTQRENGEVLNKALAGTKGLILPTEPEGHTHNWYNYTSRIDMDAVGWTGDPVLMRNSVVAALRAEGLGSVGVWQAFSLPSMTVFQAKNAYGGGIPWSLPGADEGVDYSVENYPVAEKHCATHFGMTVPLRAPNGTDVAAKTGEAFKKVFENINALDVEKITAKK
ncbi:MAG: DegT/DnrJ/EryC1/StrS family aminotransferase [Planctomycetota bacterium]|jgi:dTDP-4-amino-4,6-dideoxygalactose transaminase